MDRCCDQIRHCDRAGNTAPRTRGIPASLLIAVALCSVPHGADGQRLEPGESLTVSIGPISPPLFYFDERGQAIGFVPDLLREVAHRANVSFAFEHVPDLTALNSLDPEDRPLVTWLLAEEHPEGYVGFQRGYLTLHGAVFRRRSAALEGDIPAHKLGEVMVVANSEIEHDLLNNAWDGLFIMPTVEEAFRQLEAGKHDTIMASEFLGMAAMESLDINSIVRVTSTEMHMHQHIKLMRPRYRIDLESSLAPALDSIRKDGTYDRLYTKWFDKYEPKNVSLRTFSFTTVSIGLGTIVLGLVLVLSRRRFRRLLYWQGEALEASQTRLVDLVHSVKAIVWDATLDAQFSYVNPYAESLLGYPVTEWYTPNFFAEILLHPDDRDKVVRACFEASQRGEDHVLDYRVRAASGEIFWLHDMVKVVKDATGRPLKLTGVMVDVTSVRKAQEAAAESESRLAAIMKASPTGIIRLDRTGRVTFGNEEAARITGIRTGQVDRKRWLNAVHPEDREQVAEAWRRVSREPSGDLREYRFLHDDGAIVWVLDRGHPEVDNDGNVTGYVATLTDITPLKLAEETIRTHSQVLMQLTEAVNFTDEHGTILYTNAAFDEMFGYGAGELIGKHVSTLNHAPKDVYERVSKEVNVALAAGNSWVGEFRNRHRDGTEFWTRARAFQIQGGRVAVCVQEDITARRKAEAALRESEERFRRVAESAFVGIAVFDGEKFVFSNQTMVELSGYSPGELEGLTREEIARTFLPADRHKDVFEKLQRLDTAATTTEPAEFNELRIRRKDGTERWTNLTVSRLYPDRSFPRLFLCIDVTERVRAESTLRTRSQVLMSMAEGVVFTDPDGVILETNPAYNAMFGYGTGELIGRHVTTLTDMSQDEIDAFVADINLAFDSTGEWTGVFRNIRKDGTRVWTHASLSRAEIDGRPGIVTVQEDITESRRAAEALKESEEKFRRVAESAFVGIAVHDGTRYTFCNDAMTRVSGYSIEELAKLRREELAERLFYPDDVPVVMSKLMELDQPNASAEPVMFEDIRLRHKDGEPRWVSLMFSRMYPDKPMPRLTICIDRTDRVRAESALRESEALFRAITEQMPDCVFLLDYQDATNPGTIVYANESAARLHGMTIDEIVGCCIADLSDPSAATDMADFRRRIFSGETVRFEHTHRRKDGSLFPVEIVAQRIEALGTNTVLAIDRDLTERRQIEDERLAMEQRMLQAQKLESLGILAGGIAHDFNNLLVGILGHADLAREDLENGSTAGESLEQIEVAARRAAELTHQMLAYSGKGKFVVQRIHLDKSVREMAKLLEVSLSKKAVLRFELEPNTPPIEADSAQVQQVVMNLITNASDALGDKAGVITLRTGVTDCSPDALRKFTLGEPLTPGRYVYLEVTDTGCGMDASTLQRMFDPFFSTKFTGRGLGLASVIGIVRAHHGGLHVSSRPGAGTSFRVIFPEALSDATAVASESELNGARASSGGTILVVDDEPRVRDLVSRALGRNGFEVLTANDGPSAMELFGRHADDVCVAIIDWTMPGMNGRDVLAAFRAQRPELPTLIMSGYASSEMAGRMPDDGRSAFLQKPFTIDSLRRVVDSLLAAAANDAR